MSFKPLQTLLIFCVLFFSFFFSASETLAGNIYLPPRQSAPSQTCSITSGPGSCDPAPANCWNSQSAGVTDCGAACDGGDPWTKYNLLGCRQTRFNQCDNYYEPTQEAVCSTADKCTSTSNNPYLNAGFCNCTVGGIYKTCCTNTTPSYVASDSCVQLTIDTTNPPYEGVCPAGSSPVFCGFGSNPPCGQEACGPIAPVTCSQTRDYDQCGGTCNGITYPANHTIHVIENQCTDNTTQYQCSDLGVIAGQCGNPSTTPPSCSVSWAFSNTNPPPNSTVNVTVQGSANPNWNGSSYSLDFAPWTPDSPGPPFNFNVNSDSTGVHNLRFAINNGSTVCGNQNSQTFVTQSLNDASTCTAISVNSGNPVVTGQNYPATVSFRNDGTSTWINSGSNPYKLGSQDPQDNTVWGLNRVNLPNTVSPGNSVTFDFNVTAPATSSTYSFNWQMVHEFIGWFGSRCFYNVVVRTPPAPAPTVSLTANPASIANNTSSTLSWTTTSCTTANSCSCSASDSWSGAKSISGGTQSTGNLTGPANYTYTLTCTNSGGISLPSTANVSVGGAVCTPETNSAFCSRLSKNCGSVTGTDNCGGTRTVTSCGTCSGSQTCGGGGTPNVCGGGSCTPETDFAFCSRLGKNCGSVTASDNCGSSRTVSSCGTCSGSQTCGGGGTANVCGGSSSSSGTSPWIQTSGGDVHSNTNINTPGGP